MTTITLIGTILTAVIGPLLALFIKEYLDKKAADIAAKQRQAAEQQTNVSNTTNQAQATGTINQSIAAQQEAKDEWSKKNS